MTPPERPSAACEELGHVRLDLGRSSERGANSARPLTILAALVVVFSTIGAAAGTTGSNSAAPAPPVGHSPIVVGPTAVAEATASLAAGHGPAAGRPLACHGLRGAETASCDELPRSAAGSVTGWSDAGPNPPSQLVNDFYLVDDVSDSYVLLFGTTSADISDPAATDLWAYAGGNWTSLPASSPAPFACPGSEIAYDSADGYVLYLGASNFGYGVACASANQTWTYHAGVWTQQHPSVSPTGFVLGSMSDDPVDGYVVLFGGEAATGCPPAGYCDATWTYLAGNWTLLSPGTSPSARAESGLAYDAYDGYVLLFGGVAQSGALNDTWKFAAGNWTQLHPATSPPVPQPDAFSYDAGDKGVVYTTGGNDTSGNYTRIVYEITWIYSGGNWTAITSTPAPTARLDGQMADDPTSGVPVFFGGLADYGTQSLDDSWTLHAGLWTNVTTEAPTPRFYPAIAYDPDTGSVIMFGGADGQYVGNELNDTWSYANGSWSQLHPTKSPDLTLDSGLCWDAADGYLLLVGYSLTNGTPSTWEYAGGTWSQVTPTSQPFAPTGEGLVYDAADGYVLLLSGYVGSLQTWTYHAGVWTNRTGSVGAAPPGMTPNPLAYDSTDGEVVLFGTYYLPVPGQSPSIAPYTYTFSGGKWHNATATNATAPPGLYSATTSDDPMDNGVLLWGGQLGIFGGANNETWAFAGGNWSLLGAPTHPSPRVRARGVDDPLISEDVFFGGISLGSTTPCAYNTPACGDTWLWGSHVSPLPIIESFTVTPGTIDLGQTANLTVRAGGGTGPLTYSYLDLPPGCGSLNASTISCSPTTAGAWSIEARVVDAAGQIATATLTLTVLLDASVSAFTAVPATVALGHETTLETSAAGGTGTYSYDYTSLPPGCLTQDVPALPCTPSAAGNFSVSVLVGDGVGPVAARSTPLTVTAAGGHGDPTITSFAATPPAIVLGNTTNLSVVASGAGPMSYAYTGLPPGCTSTNLSAFNCTPTSAGTYPIEVTVLDTHHNATTVGTNFTVYPVGGGAGLAVSAFGAEPGTVMVNTTTLVQVIASGGEGSLAYAYSGLPPGCASANVATLACKPIAVGLFDVYAVVMDSAGHRAGVHTSLDVIVAIGASPQVSAFVATPNPARVNVSMTLFVAAGGGTLPFSYVFLGLPAGCASVDSPILVCTPSSSGNFTVSVNLTDAAGRVARAATVVDVLPGPGPGTLPGRTMPASGAPAWEAELTDAGLALAGAALVAAVAAGWDRRRQRREGEQLVAALDEDNARGTNLAP